MSETTTFYGHCEYCKQETDNANDVMPLFETGGFECVNRDACQRRQKRDKINAEIATKAARPVMHPVDRFTRLSIALCGIFLGAVIAIGASYVWLGI